ncbi:hypothetical protein GFS24_24450 [Chitinophaga sp. SYP-B3965]|uniref:hypothetical protein n=1 Tax=Chitinophaga sp. SYP-B3965 TaxID=2663120 RepID=UPI0012999DC5|nr:hypothetical protein [Chitinophaga sp. SYP-B3965]MRG48289.1 hypothetical protein [Chitinophaga sp. SYP-B3965]
MDNAKTIVAAISIVTGIGFTSAGLHDFFTSKKLTSITNGYELPSAVEYLIDRLDASSPREKLPLGSSNIWFGLYLLKTRRKKALQI